MYFGAHPPQIRRIHSCVPLYEAGRVSPHVQQSGNLAEWAACRVCGELVGNGTYQLPSVQGTPVPDLVARRQVSVEDLAQHAQAPQRWEYVIPIVVGKWRAWVRQS